MPVVPVVRFTLDKSAKLVRKGLENLRKAIPLVGKSRMRAVAIDIRNRMRKPGKKRPVWTGKPYIHWKSRKQQKAFFASDGFGGGIPTRRKGVYERSYKVKSVHDGVDVGSELPWAHFVGGTARSKKQSPIHKGYWRIFLEQIDAAVKKLPKSVRDHLVQTAKQNGFEAK